MAALVAKRATTASVAFLVASPASLAIAASAGAGGITNDGAMPWPLALPFAGMLLSIALGPLVVKEWWHIHYAKAAAFWAGLTLIGLSVIAGPSAAARDFLHYRALEYLPFILMLFAFYTAAGGISIDGKLNGTPLVNTSVLALGTLGASVIGTTGASLTLIRPVLRANGARRQNAHVIVFFIFLVSNIGGVLTPLGDPPLFLGYLHGVDFFWPARALWPQALFAACVLLALFLLLDAYFYRREARPLIGQKNRHEPESHRSCQSGADGLCHLCDCRKRILASGYRLRSRWNKNRASESGSRACHDFGGLRLTLGYETGASRGKWF
jgi:Putative citrate transport